MKIAVSEALEMARQLKDKIATLSRTRYTALAGTAVEEVIHWLKDEDESE